MALGDNYITKEQLKARLGVADLQDDDLYDGAVASATDGINHACGRDFQQAITATARTFYPSSPRLVIADDVHTATDLVITVDEGDDGVFDTEVPTSDVVLEPLDGVVEGVEGWPWWRIRIVDGVSVWPRGRRPSIQVTAQWGWAQVPDSITEAAYVLAEDIAKLRDTPFGVGGFGEFGRVRARENPHVAMLINPFRRIGSRLRVA